jgi:hypothetical protein
MGGGPGHIARYPSTSSSGGTGGAAQAVAEETQAVGPAFRSYRRRSPSAQSSLRAGQLECRSPAS